MVQATVLRFDDGTPVRAASGIAPYAGGWLVAQDDATHAAWWVGDDVRRLRLLPPAEGHDVFAEATGTKRLKPDLEAVTAVPGGVLALGSGSTPQRMRAVRVREDGHEVDVADLTHVCASVAAALGLDAGLLNLEGACVAGDVLRWFQRGAATVPSRGVDLDLAALLGCFDAPRDVPVGQVRTYDLGAVDGVALAVTDALALDDGTVLVSAAAEDTPNPYDDGPVVGTALALLDDTGVLAVAHLPEVGGRPLKVEGIALRRATPSALELLAVVDADDAEEPSAALVLELRR